MLGGAEREHALFGPTLFLVAPRAAEGGIKAVLVQSLLQRLRLHDVRVHLGAVREGGDARTQACLVHVHQQLKSEFPDHGVAKLVHRAELPRGIDVQQRKRRTGRIEGLHGQVQHHRAVLADRIKHHRPLALGHDLPQDVKALRLDPVQVDE